MNISDFYALHYADIMIENDECSMGQHSSFRCVCVCVCVCTAWDIICVPYDQWTIIQTAMYLQANYTRKNLIIWDTIKKGRYTFFGILLLCALYFQIFSLSSYRTLSKMYEVLNRVRGRKSLAI